MSLALQAWIALAVIFVVGEVLSPGWLLLPFGIGAACAAAIELIGGPSSWQWLAFVGVSSVLLVVSQRVLAARRRPRD
jgi:membrane protein implicated in regulation of membrane protease activity